MPLLKDLLSDKSKKKLLNHKNMDIVKAGPGAKVSESSLNHYKKAENTEFIGVAPGYKTQPEEVGGMVGATPNLNSSLGVNAFIGSVLGSASEGASSAATTSQEPQKSKLSTFWEKNSDWITGLGGAILGGSQPNTQTSPFPQEEKKKSSAWIWIVVAIVVAIVIVLIIRSATKK